MKRLWLLAVLLALLFCVTQTSFAIRPVAIGDVVHKGGGVYDVRAYGATGDGVTDDFTAIRDATTAANGNTVEFKAGTYIIGTGMTIDEDAVFYKGAVIKPSNGITVTLTGALAAGPYQTFDESAGGTVTVSNGMVNEVLPQWWNGAVILSFTDTDATPSVKKGRMFATANTAPTTITMFNDGISGQVIRVFIGDANTTLDFSGTNLKGNGGVDWTAADGDALIAGFDGTDWYCMISTPAGTVTTADKDLVSGGGLTGGEDNVLVGADSDLTLAVGAGDLVIVNADEIEVYGLVASDGIPNNAVVVDADGNVAVNSLTASRIVVSDAAKELVSSDLVSWVTGSAQIGVADDGDGTITLSAVGIAGIADILGTANQIIITDNGDGTITISTPQDIDLSADVTFDSLTLDDLTASRLVATDGAEKLISSDLVNWVTGTASEITVTDDGDGTITLSADAALTTVALKDLVSGTGLTGGEDNVLVGVDSDLTLNVVAGDGVIANADEIEVYGLVASDGTPNNAVVVDADGNVAVNSLTASRLVASDAAKELVSSDLASWVTGTASEITVTDDGDGTITLSADAALTAFPRWDQITNPNTDKTFNMGNNPTSFNFISPSGGPTYDGAFEIQANGAFVGDLLHVHQHTGNPGATNLVLLESEDADVTPLVVDGVGTKNTTFTGGYVEFNDEIVYDPSATQVIDAVGDTILADATLVILNPDADYTLTSTPHMADGVIGQIIYISAANGEAFTVTLQDEDTLGGSNFQLAGDDVEVTGQTVVAFQFDGTDWLEITGPSITNIKKLTVINELTIPTDDNPTTDDDGELALDTNDDALEVYTGGKSSLIPTVDDKSCSITDPENINREFPIWHVDADRYPHGITLVNVQIGLETDAAYSMVLEEWSGADPPVYQNDTETITTGAADTYAEVRTTDIDDRVLDADDWLFLHIPATDVASVYVKWIFYVNEGN